MDVRAAAGRPQRCQHRPGADRTRCAESVGSGSGAEPASDGRGLAASHGRGDLGEPAVHRSSGVGSTARTARGNEQVGTRARVGGVGVDGPPGLVSEADFLAAQQVRAIRPSLDGETRRYLLSGLVRCAVCGRRLDSHWVHGRPGYRCRHGRSSACPPTLGESKTVYVREDRLIDELADRLPSDHGDVAGTVATLRSSGSLITHDGTTWILTPG